MSKSRFMVTYEKHRCQQPKCGSLARKCGCFSAGVRLKQRASAAVSSLYAHKGPMETHYYYHQVEDAFRTIKRKDKVSSRVIPEVQHEA